MESKYQSCSKLLKDKGAANNLLHKLLNILDRGESAEVKKSRDGSIKVMRVRKESV